MTEDFGYSHRSCAEAKEPGYVGIPYPGVEARLSETGEVLVKVAWPDGRLLQAARPDQ